MELADLLHELMKEALKDWAEKNNETFPKHVVVFRDGVHSDCQLNVVKGQEADVMVQAINEIAKGTTFTYILVKRMRGAMVSTHFFYRLDFVIYNIRVLFLFKGGRSWSQSQFHNHQRPGRSTVSGVLLACRNSASETALLRGAGQQQSRCNSGYFEKLELSALDHVEVVVDNAISYSSKFGLFFRINFSFTAISDLKLIFSSTLTGWQRCSVRNGTTAAKLPTILKSTRSSSFSLPPSISLRVSGDSLRLRNLGTIRRAQSAILSVHTCVG